MTLDVGVPSTYPVVIIIIIIIIVTIIIIIIIIITIILIITIIFIYTCYFLLTVHLIPGFAWCSLGLVITRTSTQSPADRPALPNGNFGPPVHPFATCSQY